jgi:hypothetical protein
VRPYSLEDLSKYCEVRNVDNDDDDDDNNNNNIYPKINSI